MKLAKFKFEPKGVGTKISTSTCRVKENVHKDKTENLKLPSKISEIFETAPSAFILTPIMAIMPLQKALKEK